MPTATVLLVDQDHDSAAIYTMILEHHGYRVLHAAGGAAALDIALRERPGIVVTEIHRGWTDGVHLAQMLKQEAATAGIPVIAVTTLPVRPGKPAAALALCDGVLGKPCVPSRLLSEVERWTGVTVVVPQSA